MTSIDRSGRRRVIARPSRLACIECRNVSNPRNIPEQHMITPRQKHLKCDATAPSCSRCSTRNLKCIYTASKRGYNNRASTGMDLTPPPSQSDHQPSDATVDSQSEPCTSGPSNVQSVQNATEITPALLAIEQQLPVLPPIDKGSFGASEALLVSLFFTRFHPAHPILVPRRYGNTAENPECLRLVIQFIGSLYAPSIPSDPLGLAAAAALRANTTISAQFVQSLLLYAIVLHARNQMQDALIVLNRAIDNALALRLNQAESACYRDCNDPVIEESMRRTWWELYITDGYLAALHREASFRCDLVISSTLLPCEESAFTQGIIPIDPPSLIELRERLFAAEEISFSSFCYRIEAVRIIGRLLAVAGSLEATLDSVQAVDNAIASWKLHLPDNKSGILDDLGQVDQMMCQAHMLVNLASILLHFPRSDLPLELPVSFETPCAKDLAVLWPTSNQHSMKAVTASKEICNLAALPVEQSSPFFVCGLVFSCMVQLSTCRSHAGIILEQHRDRVALMTGVLRSLGRTWEIANCALARLRPVAGSIFQQERDMEELPPRQLQSHGIDEISLPDATNGLDWFNLFDSMQGQTFTDSEWMTY